MKDEIWTMKDGTKIAVSDMSESHVRNALRMVIRNMNKAKARAALRRAAALAGDDWMTVGDIQDELSNQAYNRLSDPGSFFPLLEGGRHGSPELAARYDPRKRG